MRFFTKQSWISSKWIKISLRVHGLVASFHCSHNSSSKVQHVIVRLVIMLKVPISTITSVCRTRPNLCSFGLPPYRFVSGTMWLLCFTLIHHVRTGSNGANGCCIRKSGAFGRLVTTSNWRIWSWKGGGWKRTSWVLFIGILWVYL